MKIEEFDALRKKIEDAKAKKARAEGALEESMNRLLKDFKCKTIEEADAKLIELQKDIDADEIKLSDLLKKIKAACDWDSL